MADEEVAQVPAPGPEAPLQGTVDDEAVIADPSLVGSDLSAEKMNTLVVRGYVMRDDLLIVLLMRSRYLGTRGHPEPLQSFHGQPARQYDAWVSGPRSRM